MSNIRCQLKQLLPSLAAQANQLKDRAAKERYYLLRAVAESSKPINRVCESRGRSTDFFFKWARRLIESGKLSSLSESSRKPKISPNLTSEAVTQLIKRLRKKYPAYGPERISFYLKLKYQTDCPPSTVYAVLKRLGLVSKAYRAQRTKAHIKRYRRPFPGWLQVDIKYVPYYVQAKKYYQISAIDHHSSWRFIRTYQDRSEDSVIEFLNEMKVHCPFEIFQIQTDNATEFTDKYSSGRGVTPSGSHVFDRWCESHGIEHKLIPIGEKELNGKVENSHKFDDAEFYSLYRANTPEDLTKAIRRYCEVWNTERHTKTLGWKTPLETVVWSQIVGVVAMLIHQKTDLETFLSQNKNLKRKTTPLGSITYREKSKPKPQTHLSRYLQYADWEEKKRLKSIMVWPPISQNFSL